MKVSKVDHTRVAVSKSKYNGPGNILYKEPSERYNDKELKAYLDGRIRSAQRLYQIFNAKAGGKIQGVDEQEIKSINDALTEMLFTSTDGGRKVRDQKNVLIFLSRQSHPILQADKKDDQKLLEVLCTFYLRKGLKEGEPGLRTLLTACKESDFMKEGNAGYTRDGNQSLAEAGNNSSLTEEDKDRITEEKKRAEEEKRRIEEEKNKIGYFLEILRLDFTKGSNEDRGNNHSQKSRRRQGSSRDSIIKSIQNQNMPVQPAAISTGSGQQKETAFVLHLNQGVTSGDHQTSSRRQNEKEGISTFLEQYAVLDPEERMRQLRRLRRLLDLFFYISDPAVLPAEVDQTDDFNVWRLHEDRKNQAGSFIDAAFVRNVADLAAREKEISREWKNPGNKNDTGADQNPENKSDTGADQNPERERDSGRDKSREQDRNTGRNQEKKTPEEFKAEKAELSLEKRKASFVLREAVRNRIMTCYRYAISLVDSGAYTDLFFPDANENHFWIHHFEYATERILKSLNEQKLYKLQLGFLTEKVWKDALNFLSVKYVALGKAVFNYAMPGLGDTDGDLSMGVLSTGAKREPKESGVLSSSAKKESKGPGVLSTGAKKESKEWDVLFSGRKNPNDSGALYAGAKKEPNALSAGFCHPGADDQKRAPSEAEKGISSFDYEMIKAHETLQRETAVSVSFAVNNLARAAIDTSRKGSEDFLQIPKKNGDSADGQGASQEAAKGKKGELPASLETLKKNPEAGQTLRAILQFFGGASTWKTDLFRKAYAAADTDYETQFLYDLQQNMGELRNGSFHFRNTGKTAPTWNTGLIADMFEEETRKCIYAEKERFYSNNLPMFYADKDLETMLNLLYSAYHERASQVPSFGSVIVRNSLPAFLTSELHCHPSMGTQDTVRWQSAVYYLLKEIYYNVFLQDQSAKALFYAALDELKKDPEQNSKKNGRQALEDFTTRCKPWKGEEQFTLSRICQAIMTEYNLQNTNQRQAFGNAGREEPIYQHYKMLLMKTLRKAFSIFIKNDPRFSFIYRNPIVVREMPEKEAFLPEWETPMYHALAEAVRKDPSLQSWYITCRFLNGRMLSLLSGSVRSYIRYVGDIRRRAAENDCCLIRDETEKEQIAEDAWRTAGRQESASGEQGEKGVRPQAAESGNPKDGGNDPRGKEQKTGTNEADVREKVCLEKKQEGKELQLKVQPGLENEDKNLKEKKGSRKKNRGQLARERREADKARREAERQAKNAAEDRQRRELERQTREQQNAAQPGLNRTAPEEYQEVRYMRQVVQVIDFCTRLASAYSADITDYFRDNEDYAEYLSHFVRFYGDAYKAHGLSYYSALVDFCTRGREQPFDVYVDEKNPKLNRNIIESRLFGPSEIIAEVYDPITEQDLLQYYQLGKEIDAYRKEGVCHSEEDQKKLLAFQRLKNHVELRDVEEYGEIVNELLGQLINWSYLRERDLMYFQLGFHYLCLHNDSAKPDEYRCITIGKEEADSAGKNGTCRKEGAGADSGAPGSGRTIDGAILYQIAAMNMNGLPVFAPENRKEPEGRLEPLAARQSNGAKVGRFVDYTRHIEAVSTNGPQAAPDWAAYDAAYREPGTFLYYAGLELFENIHEHDNVVADRNAIVHFKYYQVAKRQAPGNTAPDRMSLLDYYSEVFDRFFSYDMKFQKNVVNMLENILSRHFILFNPVIASGTKAIGAGRRQKEKERAQIGIKRGSLKADSFTYKITGKKEQREPADAEGAEERSSADRLTGKELGVIAAAAKTGRGPEERAAVGRTGPGSEEQAAGKEGQTEKKKTATTRKILAPARDQRFVETVGKILYYPEEAPEGIVDGRYYQRYCSQY